LERATHLRKEYGGGSLTALPIVSTEAGNISAYIPTNIISITDGQIYLSTSLFQKGILPAIDTGRSVSRVGGDAQLPAYRSLVGPLKLFYSQFEELESFAKFGTQLDKETEKQLKRGRAIRAVMGQMQYHLMPAETQIAVFMATNAGLLDNIPEDKILPAQEVIDKTLHRHFETVVNNIVNKREKIDGKTQENMLLAFKTALEQEGIISE
jgi:F-type H+-transporting ATPase subunit alpha